MARRGRPRRTNAKRDRRGRAIREPSVDHGTPELLEKRRALVGTKFVKDQRSGDPLGVLCLNGHITDDQRQAGIEYARLCWAMFGRPFPASSSYGESIPRSDTGYGPRAPKIVQDNWKRADTILRNAGSGAKREVRNVAVEWRMPAWFKRGETSGVVRPSDAPVKQKLIRGLRELARTMSAWRLTSES